MSRKQTSIIMLRTDPPQKKKTTTIFYPIYTPENPKFGFKKLVSTLIGDYPASIKAYSPFCFPKSRKILGLNEFKK